MWVNVTRTDEIVDLLLAAGGGTSSDSFEGDFEQRSSTRSFENSRVVPCGHKNKKPFCSSSSHPAFECGKTELEFLLLLRSTFLEFGINLSVGMCCNSFAAALELILGRALN